MIRFAHIEYLWLLVLVPVFILLFYFVQRNLNRKLSKLGSQQLIENLIPERSRGKKRAKFIFILLAYISIVLALTNPLMGTKQETVKRKGIDIIIALDLSKSMLAEDLAPNRLERSKRLISSMIAEMRSDRVGFIIFAGNAYLQMPLTIDYSAFEMYLRSVNTDIIPTQGTAIGKSIDLALQAFEGEQQKHKALIIISDGEDFAGDVFDKAKEAAKAGVKIFTIGVGTPKGAPIPVYNKFGQRVDYKKDKSGSIILTKIDEQTLQQLAAHGNGQYFRLVGRETTKALFDELSKVEKKEIEELVYTDYEEQFQYFLFLGLIFVLIEILITHKKSSFFRKLKLFEE